MKRTIFEGCCTAMVTPFARDAKVDYTKLELLIERQIENGIDALLFCGTTGEGSTLSETEQLSIFCFAVSVVNGRVPVIANIGSNDTAKTLRMAKSAAYSGIDALLAITPYYNKTSQTGLLRHFDALQSCVQLPVMLYNVPSRTGMCISPQSYAELAKMEHIVAVKEANSDLSAVMASLPLYRSGQLHLYSGNDDLALPLISCGAKGLVSVISNVLPKQTAQLCKLALNGETEQAAALQCSMMPQMKALFDDVNPIPIKFAMRAAGVQCGECRLPLCEPAQALQEKLTELFQA